MKENIAKTLRNAITRYETKFASINEYLEIVQEYDNLVDNPRSSCAEYEELLKKYLAFEKSWEHAKIVYSKQNFAILAGWFAFLAILIGAIVGLVTKNFWVFALCLLSSILLSRESEHVENYYFIPRMTGKFFFFHKSYCLAVGIFSLFLFIKMNGQGYEFSSFVFIITVLIQIVLLLIFDKDVEHDRLKNQYR